MRSAELVLGPATPDPWEDVEDHDHLRFDPVMEVLAGKLAAKRRDCAPVAGNLVWLLLAGWWLALLHILVALALAITLIGIPFAWAHLKLVPISLWPIGKVVLDRDEAERLRGRRDA